MLKSNNVGGSMSEVIVNFNSFVNWNGDNVRIQNNKHVSAFFISVYCSHCIDLLPYLNYAEEKWDGDIILFSNGSDEDHEEMVKYFKWGFNVVSITEEQMEKQFNVASKPCVILIDEKKRIYDHIPLNTIDDFISII